MEYEEMTIKVVEPIAYIEHKHTRSRIKGCLEEAG